MRNLKKAMVLVLSLAMMLSVMVMGAGAAFTDQKDVDTKHQEAVDIAVTLNIINGYPDGSFQPNGNVTREEMAKMICILDNGGKEPQLATGSTFTDVAADRWSNKYIEACAARGVVAGVGNNMFNPSGNVTATQAARMLLVELGYDEDLANYTGPNWATNVNVDATKKGYYEKLEDIDVTSPLTREHAAQMVWNALQANEVEYKNTLTTDPVTGQLASKVDVQDKTIDLLGTKQSLLRDKYDAIVDDECIMEDVFAVTTGANKGTFQIWTDLYAAPFTKVSQSYADLLGQEVKVVHKLTAAGGPAMDDVLGIYPTDQNMVVKSVQSALSNDGAKVKVDGVKYELDTRVDRIDIDPVAGDVTYVVAPGITAAGLVNHYSYNEITLIDNDGNNKIDVVVNKIIQGEEVTYASSSEVIAGGRTFDVDDHNIETGLAKDDFVSIAYNIEKDCCDVLKVATNIATVDSKKAATNEYRIDGTWYYYDGSEEAVTQGDKIEYAALNGVLIPKSVDSTSDNVNDVVLVLNAANSGLNYGQARIMHFDGKIEAVDVSKDSTVKIAGIIANRGRLMVAESDSSGYDFKNLNYAADAYGDWTAFASGGANIAVDANNNPTTISGVGIADDATILVYSGAALDAKAITGKQLKSAVVGAANGDINNNCFDYLAGTVKGLDRVAYAVVNLAAGDFDDMNLTTGKDKFAYVTDDSYVSKVDGTNYTVFSIWDGTQNVTDVKVKGTAIGALAVGDVVKYDDIKDGVMEGAFKQAITNGAAAPYNGVKFVGAIQGLEGDYIFVDGTTNNDRIKLTGDTKYLYVDSNESKAENMGKTTGDVVKADKNAGIFVDNIIVLTNNQAEADLVIVDVKNKMTCDGLNNGLTASGVFSKTSDLQVGDSVDMTLTGLTPGQVYTVVLNNGNFAATGTDTMSVAANGSGKIMQTVFIQANGLAVASTTPGYVLSVAPTGAVNGMTCTASVGAVETGDAVTFTFTGSAAAAGTYTVTLTNGTSGTVTVAASDTTATITIGDVGTVSADQVATVTFA